MHCIVLHCMSMFSLCLCPYLCPLCHVFHCFVLCVFTALSPSIEVVRHRFDRIGAVRYAIPCFVSVCLPASSHPIALHHFTIILRALSCASNAPRIFLKRSACSVCNSNAYFFTQSHFLHTTRGVSLPCDRLFVCSGSLLPAACFCLRVRGVCLSILLDHSLQFAPSLLACLRVAERSQRLLVTGVTHP